MNEHFKIERPQALDARALNDKQREISKDQEKGELEYAVATKWKGRARSESMVNGARVGGRHVSRRYCMCADEPYELMGDETAPNPQEYLITGLNSCLVIGYVAAASERDIKLDNLEIETTGNLNLAGFMGVDARVPPGFLGLRTHVKIKGKATDKQFRDMHEHVMATSPNFFNLSRMIPYEATLEIE